MATEEDIAYLVAFISAAYPNFNASEATVDVYYQMLNDIDRDLLFAATKQSVSEAGRKFAPSVGEIRGNVAEINRTIAKTPTSFQAWSEVLKVISAFGSYRKPEFSHQLIAETVNVMGWKELCLSVNQVSDRARFVQAYEQLQSRYETDSMRLPDVKGYIETASEQRAALETGERDDINHQVKALTRKVSS